MCTRVCPSQRLSSELEVEKNRLGEMEQLGTISKAMAYGDQRRKEAEVRIGNSILLLIPARVRLVIFQRDRLDGVRLLFVWFGILNRVAVAIAHRAISAGCNAHVHLGHPLTESLRAT